MPPIMPKMRIKTYEIREIDRASGADNPAFAKKNTKAPSRSPNPCMVMGIIVIRKIIGTKIIKYTSGVSKPKPWEIR